MPKKWQDEADFDKIEYTKTAVLKLWFKQALNRPILWKRHK